MRGDSAVLLSAEGPAERFTPACAGTALQWPRVIQPTPEEVAQTATSLSTAAGGVPVLSQETAVEMFSTVAGLDSPEEEMARLQASSDQTLDRLRESIDAADKAKDPKKTEA